MHRPTSSCAVGHNNRAMSASRHKASEVDMSTRNNVLAAALLLATAPALAAEISFYEGEDFRGRVFSTDRPIQNLNRSGFNNRASSVIVESGRWEVCEEKRFGGRCTLLRRGSYESLERMGINNRISSVRPISRDGDVGRDRDNDRYSRDEREPLPEPTYAYRRRPDERLIEVPVTSVRAVVGPPEQRCWLEREQVSNERRPNVGGAIAGAIIGGILGHQIGSGRGNDVATAGGAIAGGAVGSQVGRGERTTERDVERCERVASQTPEYWDVSYNFRGLEHRVQMTSPPGRTILVNREGEPRA
jgi:uncharacterized protein YcfJ